jgi:5-methylcytosine-specific restriction endonuclease McrA
LDRGGSNYPANLVPSCRSCNRKKYIKNIWEFLATDRRTDGKAR